MLPMILTRKKLLKVFTENSCKNQIKSNYMLNRKDTIISLLVGLIKRNSLVK